MKNVMNKVADRVMNNRVIGTTYRAWWLVANKASLPLVSKVAHKMQCRSYVYWCDGVMPHAVAGMDQLPTVVRPSQCISKMKGVMEKNYDLTVMEACLQDDLTRAANKVRPTVKRLGGYLAKAAKIAENF